LGRYGVPESAYFRLHVDGTCALLRACAAPSASRADLKRFVYCSSPGMLGPVGPSDLPRDETSAHHPTGVYERSKSEAEKAALPLAAALGVPLVVARPEFVYGPGDQHVLGLFQAVRRRRFFYIGSGENLCHPSYVDDVVAGLIACSSERAQTLGAYHICGPRPVTWKEFATAIAGALGVPSPTLHLPVSLARVGAWSAERVADLIGIEPPLSLEGVRFFTESRAFSIAKAARELGWTPKVDVEEGARRAVQWYRSQGML
jgi:nucleoside-diphosphate-sugar epimerase